MMPGADFDSSRQQLVERHKGYKDIATYSLVAAVAVALILFTRAVPYLQTSPGPMYNTIGAIDGTQLVSITGAKTYPTAGELNLMTVRERGGPFGEITLPEVFFSWFNPVEDVVPTSVFYPEGTTRQDAQQQNAIQFDNSQAAAAAAAMKSLGYKVTETVIVARVVPDSPAVGVLEVGDQLISVSGTKVESPQQAVKLIQSQKPDKAVAIEIKRDSKVQIVKPKLTASERDSSRGFLGVQPSDHYEGPIDVKFGVEGVGGPSAGMMFSLAILDKLTSEQLNAGKVVSGTGTMNSDGEVGPVGGVKQKLAAAAANGSELFLVAKGNCDDVIENPPEAMPVAPVETLDQALEVLKKWRAGETDLPTCESAGAS